MYEILVLPKSWLFSLGDPHHFDVLTAVINKAYSKPMARYGIIQSTRIKNSAHFLEQMQISPEKECFIALLLASEQVFSRIENETGFVRKFDMQVFPLANSLSSDIPKKYLAYFEPLKSSNVKVTIADLRTEIDSKIAARLLALCGYKTFYSNREHDISVREYELTAFTSFLSGMGTQLLDYTLKNMISNPDCGLMQRDNVLKCIVHAVVIKEHDLVPYYTTYCQFNLWGHPDCLVAASGTDSPLEDGILASQDFHLAYLRREISMARA